MITKINIIDFTGNDVYSTKPVKKDKYPIFECTCSSKKKDKISKAEKNVNNMLGAFIVEVDDLDYAWKLLNIAQQEGLTVQGDGSVMSNTKVSTLLRGMHLVTGDTQNSKTMNNLLWGDNLVFFRDDKYDIIRTTEWNYARNKGITEILNVSDDFYEILSRIRKAGKEKRELLAKSRSVIPTLRQLKMNKIDSKEYKKEDTSVKVRTFNHFTLIEKNGKCDVVFNRPNDRWII